MSKILPFFAWSNSWEKLLKQTLAEVGSCSFTLLLAPFASKLVYFKSHSEPLENPWTSTNLCFRRKFTIFRNTFKLAKCFNALSYINGRPSAKVITHNFENYCLKINLCKSKTVKSFHHMTRFSLCYLLNAIWYHGIYYCTFKHY